MYKKYLWEFRLVLVEDVNVHVLLYAANAMLLAENPNDLQ